MPLLSIEFAVFFIVFLPLYWAFARLPQSSKRFTFGCRTWAGFYRIDPIFCRADLVLLVCGLPDQRADVF